MQDKNRPVSVATAGNGSSNHLALELLMRQANLTLLHVPYKGSGPAITDLLGSQVDAMVDQLSASIGHIRDGRIKALAVTSKTRSAQLPNVPTLDELGVKDFEVSTFTGIFGPAGMPAPVAEKLQRSAEEGAVGRIGARKIPLDGRGSDGHEPGRFRRLREAPTTRSGAGRARGATSSSSDRPGP